MVGVLKSGPVERVPRRRHGVVVSGQFLSSNAIGSEMLQKNAFRGFMDRPSAYSTCPSGAFVPRGSPVD